MLEFSESFLAELKIRILDAAKANATQDQKEFKERANLILSLARSKKSKVWTIGIL